MGYGCLNTGQDGLLGGISEGFHDFQAVSVFSAEDDYSNDYNDNPLDVFDFYMFPSPYHLPAHHSLFDGALTRTADQGAILGEKAYLPCCPSALLPRT